MFSVLYVCQSVCLGQCLLVLVHLGTPVPDLFKRVRYVFHTSVGKRMIVLRLKGLLVAPLFELDFL